MNHLYESVSYLRGLAEGLEIEDSKKGKMFFAIIDALDDMADSINALNEDIDDLDEYVDAIEEDLTDLEDDFYDDDFYDDDLIETICPKCGELIMVDDPFLCENCGELIVDCPVCGATVDLSEEGYYDEVDACDLIDIDEETEDQLFNDKQCVEESKDETKVAEE